MRKIISKFLVTVFLVTGLGMFVNAPSASACECPDLQGTVELYMNRLGPVQFPPPQIGGGPRP